MKKEITYAVFCYIPGCSTQCKISCREMLIRDGAYTFWRGEYGETNKLIACYPVMYTIIELVETEDDIEKV